MPTLLFISSLVAMETVLIVWLSLREPVGPILVVHVNMVLIALFAPALIEVYGHVTNVGNIFYAAATCAQVILLAQHGPEVALISIKRVNVLLIGVFVLGAGLERMPVLPGNEPFMDAMRVIVHHSLSIVTASFAAFFLSQAVLIRAWERLSAHHGPVVAGVLASCLCQAVDSPVFFAIAFWDQMPLAQLADAASTGFLLKSALAVAFVPAFVGAVYGPELMRRLISDPVP